MMGSSSCLPAREAFPRCSSLLRFLSSRTDECTGNGGPGLNEYSATTGRLGLGLLGLEGDALGSGALFTRDRDNQLFLGLGRQRVPAETVCGTFDLLDWRDGCNFFVDGSRSRCRWQEKPCRTSMSFLAGACMRSRTASERISSQGSLAEPRLCRELAPHGLLLWCYWCYRSSTQVEELVLEVLPPLPRSLHLASKS